MKILKRTLILASSLLIFALIYIQSQDFNSYKAKVIGLISATTGFDTNINGNIRLKFLPYISLEINDIELAQKGVANFRGKINLAFSIRKLLVGSFDIKHVTIDKAKVVYKKTNSSYQDMLKQFLRSTSLESVSLIDSDLIYLEDNALAKEYESIDLTISLRKAVVLLDAKFLVNEQLVNVKGKLEKNTKEGFYLSNLNLSSNSFNADLIINKDSLGNLNIKVKDLSKFAEIFLSGYDIFAFSSKEIVNITSNFSIGEGNNVVIDSLKAISDNIKLEGSLEFNLQEKTIKKIDFIADNLNIDNLMKNSNGKREYTSGILKELNFDRTENSSFKLDIKNLVYNQQKLSNIKISATAKDQNIAIDPIILQLPFSSKLELVGKISNNKFRNVFEGEALIIGESLEKLLGWWYKEFNSNINDSKYIFRSTVYLTPLELSLSDINFTVSNASVSGNFSKRFSSLKDKINFDLVVNNFDFDKFLQTSNWLKGFTNFRKGLANENYLVNFQGIRNLSYGVRGKALLNNVKFNNLSINKLQTYLDLASSKVELNDLEFISDQIDMVGKVKVAIEDLQPLLDIKLSGNSLSLQKLAKFFNMETSVTLDDYRLDRFKGRIDLDFKSIDLEKENLSNVSAGLELNHDRINISQIKADSLGGNVELLGYFAPQVPDFGISFGLSNIDGAKIFQLIFGQNSFSGPVSLGGSIYSSRKGNEWISNLVSNFSLAGRGVSISGIDLQSIIDFSREKNIYDQATFDKVISNALSGGVSYAEKLDGSFKINNGILQTNSLVFSSKNATGGIAGSFDLKNQLMNVAMKVNFVPRFNAKPTPIILKAKGNFANPEKTIEANLLSDFLKAINLTN